MAAPPKFQESLAGLGNETQDLLDRVAEVAPFGIYVDDPTRGCVYANPALLGQFGLAWEAFEGFGWARHVVAEDAVRLTEAIKRYEVELQPIFVSYRVRPQAGEEIRWIHARVHPILNASGEHIGSVGLTRDVTEERALRAHVGKAQREEAVGRLAARVAHDFNNLLGVMLMSCSMVTPSNDRDERFLGTIQTAIDQARLITSRLMNIAKGSSKTGVACLDDEVAVLEPLLARTLGEGISLDVLLKAPGDFVPLDKGQLGQVVLNLATNGRDAMEGSGTLSLHTKASDGVVQLTVSDTGVGMSPETAARAFEAFFTTKEQGRGTGLGLASVKDLVEIADGSIELETKEGHGTTVTVKLPTVGAGLAQVPRPQAPSATGEGTRVLLVEDHSALRQSLAYALALSGFEVKAAETLAGAKATLAAQPCDVLVTDVMLPDGNSVEWVEELRQSRPELPIVFTSGFTGEVGERIPNDARTSFLAKPFRPEELLAAVQSVLPSRT